MSPTDFLFLVLAIILIGIGVTLLIHLQRWLDDIRYLLDFEGEDDERE